MDKNKFLNGVDIKNVCIIMFVIFWWCLTISFPNFIPKLVFNNSIRCYDTIPHGGRYRTFGLDCVNNLGKQNFTTNLIAELLAFGPFLIAILYFFFRYFFKIILEVYLRR